MTEFYLDDLFAEKPPKHPWPRRLWRCPDTAYLAERGAVRCTRRRWHKGGHRNGVAAWGFRLPSSWDPPMFSEDPHWVEWAQTCPLNEWVRYEGPRFSCEVYMTTRPTRKTPTG